MIPLLSADVFFSSSYPDQTAPQGAVEEQS